MARLKGKTDEYCIGQLEYAKKLYDQDIPIIYNTKHLSALTGYSEDYLYAVSNDATNFYRYFTIPKRNGKTRQINEPLPSLKEVQYWILQEILIKLPVSPYAKAYINGKSIKDNARFHKRQQKVLSMDLKDFFPSISYGRILSVFRKTGYREQVAVMLANICSLNNGLPQGAPTSPALSNIIAKGLDFKIEKYIKNKKIRYTRYADDLTFSGDFNEGDLIKNIERIASQQGFWINHEKTRVRKRNQRQEVTGIVVNEKMQVNRKLRRQLRSTAYYIQKYGYVSHIEHTGQTRRNYLYYLIGLASYALFINPSDKNMRHYLDIFKNELANNKNNL